MVNKVVEVAGEWALITIIIIVVVVVLMGGG